MSEGETNNSTTKHESVNHKTAVEIYEAFQKILGPMPPPDAESSGYDWHPTALLVRDEIELDLSSCVRREAERMAKARRSRVVTDADVHEANKRIMVPIVESNWIKLGRGAMSLLIFLSGLAVTHALSADIPQKTSNIMVAVGIGAAVSFYVLQEFLFRRKT